MIEKIYLGDGAYVAVGSFLGEIVLTTEDGCSAQNRVVLGPREIRNLLDYLKHLARCAEEFAT